ncbi:MAG: class I SAM-dependent methyltransferase [Microcoleaceae cyanobacterium]
MNNKTKPDWAGSDFLSKAVNLLIQTPPLYKLMKHQARQVMIKTAEKNDIPWRQTHQQLTESGIQNSLNKIINPEITYPEYYQKPFHAYQQGNLCWDAAFEAESATYAMGLRIWRDEQLSWQTAHNRLRSSFHQILSQYTPKPVKDILDIGCSVGISTQSLHQYYSKIQPTPVKTIGLDLSPYMLSVAKWRDINSAINQWKHAQAEDTGFADNSFDLVTLQFVIHELPQLATKQIFQEIWRILRPGGCLGILDNNPKSPVIQNLPPVLFTLMKSTEPWTDEYYQLDVETTLQEIGFDHQTTVATDPRHRTIIATKTP